MSLIDRIRAERRLEIKVGDAVYFADRPTYEEFGVMYRTGITDAEICRQHVTGWSGVKEKDLIKGGGDELIPYSKPLFDEAISEMPDTWKVIATTLTSAVMQHHDTTEANAKNSLAG